MGIRAVVVGLTAALAVVAAYDTAAAEGPIVITIKDGKFVPSELSVPAGQKLTLLVQNHDKSTSEFESTDLHREKIVGAGQQITVFVGPLDPGSYEFFDDFHPDDRGHLIAK